MNDRNALAAMNVSGNIMIDNDIKSTAKINNPKFRVLLGITGSIAAVKGPELAVRLVKELGFEVKVLLTRGGSNFWGKAKDYDRKRWDELQSMILSSNEDDGDKKVVIYSYDDEWKDYTQIGDSVLHIDLRNWANMIVIAPLSAHTMAKIANGLCDDTLSCVVRAWDYTKPIILAPAMNTAMWKHPITQHQIQTICGFGSSSKISIVEPIVKKLACGEIGQGALATIDDIIKVIKEKI